MNKRMIKEIILDQTEEKKRILRSGRIIERENLGLWKQFVENELIKVTMGVRRSGKTVFTHLLLGGQDYAFANFDDERLAFVGTEDLNYILEALYETYGDFEYLLLDEVQNVQGWELFVNRLQRRGINVFVTGSNANLLSRELSTHLTGRYIRMEIFPFSFREFLLWKGINKYQITTKARAMYKRYLEEYIMIGGFPEVVKSPELRNTYLPTLYSSIITRDIVARHNIRFVKTFREMAANIISNFSQIITYNKLKNVHGLKSVHTAKNYMDYLSEAYIVQIVEKYSQKPKEIVNSPKKVYIVDSGLINSFSLSATENKGRLIENLFFIELLRKKSLDRDMEIYYWKDYQDREIDFVVRKGKKVEKLIQVTYATGKDEIEKREKKSLLKGSELLGCKSLTVITWDYEDEENTENRKIVYIPLWKWLLEK